MCTAFYPIENQSTQESSKIHGRYRSFRGLGLSPPKHESMTRRTQNTAWETRETGRGGGVALINFPFAMPAKRKRHWRDYFNLHRSVRNYFIEAGWPPPPPPTRAKIHRRRFSTKLQFTNIANGLVFNRILVKLESLLWNLGPTIPRDHPQCKLICRLLHDFIYLFFLF